MKIEDVEIGTYFTVSRIYNKAPLGYYMVYGPYKKITPFFSNNDQYVAVYENQMSFWRGEEYKLSFIDIDHVNQDDFEIKPI
jgi:hypothetical protein